MVLFVGILEVQEWFSKLNVLSALRSNIIAYPCSLFSFLLVDVLIKGRAHPERSGFDGPWTKEPLKFDNSYFV